jgi:hypothetical protein
MAGGEGAKVRSGPSTGVPTELIAYLRNFLGAAEPRFLLILGRVGSGKSTLLRSLVPEIPGPKLFVAYQPVAGPGTPGPDPSATAPPVPMLLVDPQLETASGAASAPDDPGRPTAGALRSEGGIAGPLAEAVARLSGHATRAVIVDSWDRSSEAYFRSFAKSPAAVRTFATPTSDLVAMQSTILSTPIHLILVMTPESAGPLLTIADAVVELTDERQPQGVVRVSSVPKVRGVGASPPTTLYTLDGASFRSLPALPVGFRPPLVPAEPDPDPKVDSGWPGSVAFAQAFGRLRYGGMTAITLSADCPDTIPFALTLPVVAHALQRGGRVVWIPAPEARPSRVVGLLREIVPDDWLRERLRILSASGSDSALGEMGRIILPLTREVGEGRDLRAASAPGVGPLFPGAYRFLRDHPSSTPAVYVVSLEGLRAAASAAGQTLDASTLPAVAGYYTRIPQYHLFSYGAANDPAAPLLMPMIDILLRLEMVHGRPVVFGVRPKTDPLLLDWGAGDGRYLLRPAA